RRTVGWPRLRVVWERTIPLVYVWIAALGVVAIAYRSWDRRATSIGAVVDRGVRYRFSIAGKSRSFAPV
ncbi:MAG: hypothetical protein ACQETB_02260, partial [Halobacteriota archaeon]